MAGKAVTVRNVPEEIVQDFVDIQSLEQLAKRKKISLDDVKTRALIRGAKEILRETKGNAKA